MKDAAKWAAVALTLILALMGAVWVMSQTFQTKVECNHNLEMLLAHHEKDMLRFEKYMQEIREVYREILRNQHGGEE